MLTGAYLESWQDHTLRPHVNNAKLLTKTNFVVAWLHMKTHRNALEFEDELIGTSVD